MKDKRKKFLLVFSVLFLILFLFFLIHQVSAQDLEIKNYPKIPGTEVPKNINTPLSTYLKYIYNLSIILAGLLSFILAVWGGVKYITAGPRPAKIADAREQIAVALLGAIIVFTAYLVLNTINPELVSLNISLPSADYFGPDSSYGGNPDIPNITLREVPVGSLITSEYLASSFLTSNEPDINYASTTWPASSTPPGQYSTDFQGALHGARLKRIHETASTTLPVIDYLTSVLFKNFMDTENEMMTKVNDLYHKAMDCKCSCGTCDCGTCYTDEDGNCICNCHCTLDTCPDRQGMIDLADKIPLYYDEDANPQPPLRCEMAEIEYLQNALNAFLNIAGKLVKNDDFQDNSYWYSDDAKELREKIEDCIDAGVTDQEEYDRIEELVWNSTSSMASVENKGTYAPKTEIPERDVGENLSEIESLLRAMKDIKRELNPFDQDKGYLHLMSFAESVTLEQEYNTIPNVLDYWVLFSNGPQKVDVKNDPATFYSAASSPFPFGPPKSGPSSPAPEPDLLPWLWPLKAEAVWATSSVDQLDFDLEMPTSFSSNCNYVVEIPIGRALDEAIKLVTNILKEFKNISSQSHSITKGTAKTVEEGQLADQMFEHISNLIEAALSIPKCPEGCISKQDDCSCVCEEGSALTEAKQKVQNEHNEVTMRDSQIQGLFAKATQSQASIFDSFFKLNSEYPEEYPKEGKMVPHPNAGERVPIGKDYVCTDKFGNCRKDDGTLDNDKIEKRGYTLKEKLVDVQKLLDMSRETIDPQEGTSVYEQLLEQLVDLNLINKRELSFFRKIDSIEKMDLQNCHIFFETMKKGEKKTPSRAMFNCRDAEALSAIDHFDKEMCSPDPYLDGNFFFATSSRALNPRSCYCYDEDADKDYYNILDFPELYQGFTFLGFGNNYFCCIKENEQ